MNWVCEQCSTKNQESRETCFLCGCAKPRTKTPPRSVPSRVKRSETEPIPRSRTSPAPSAVAETESRFALWLDQPRTSKIYFSHFRMTVESVKEDARNTLRFWRRLFGHRT